MNTSKNRHVKLFYAMSEENKVDSDYKVVFNLGYELAKELNLKSPIFMDFNSGDDNTNAMQAAV